MPTYQYVCTACSEPLEAVQSFTDAALTECPACGGALRKVFSAVGVVFKGSGFYKTDSRKSTSDGATKTEPAKTDAAAKDSSAATKSESSSSSSGDSSSGGTKPAPKAPATPAAKSA